MAPMTPVQLERAKRIEEARVELGLSQEALARELRVDVKTVRRWINEGRAPRVHNLKRLAEQTGRSIAWFMPQDAKSNSSLSPTPSEPTDEEPITSPAAIHVPGVPSTTHPLIRSASEQSDIYIEGKSDAREVRSLLRCDLCGEKADTVHFLSNGHYPRHGSDVQAVFCCPEHTADGYWLDLDRWFDPHENLAKHIDAKSWGPWALAALYERLTTIRRQGRPHA